MLFNTWFGQMRFQQVRVGNNERAWTHRPKRPIGKIQLRDLRPASFSGKRQSVEYRADKLGNMDVTAKGHIEDFVLLGWPIYNGVFLEPTAVTDMLWPNDPAYNQRVLEGLNRTRG